MSNPTPSAQSGVTKEDIEKRPWKYVGYRGFSTFLASDNDFLILRRFGTLHARVLLALQDQICVLEETLNSIDREASRKEAPHIHNGSFRTDQVQNRMDLILQIDKKLREYNELVLQHSQLRARPRVPLRDQQSVSNWLYNKENAIRESEVAFVDQRSDLFSMVPKSKSSLRRLLERSRHFRLARFWRTEPTGLGEDPAFDHGDTYYTSDEKIDRFVNIIILLLGVLMLISPLWTLQYVSGTTDRLGVITIFIVLFLGLLSFTTVAKPFESLAAAAAYSAVLMVFIQSAGA